MTDANDTSTPSATRRGARACPDLGRVPDYARSIAADGLHSAGQTQYRRYVEGESLTPKEALSAVCYSCMNGFVDGRQDCRVYACPVYPWQPFRSSGSDSE